MEDKNTEVFISNIHSSVRANKTIRMLEHNFPNLKFNYDLENIKKPYPCGNTIIRAEGRSISPKEIVEKIIATGIKCEVLEDRICK